MQIVETLSIRNTGAQGSYAFAFAHALLGPDQTTAHDSLAWNGDFSSR